MAPIRSAGLLLYRFAPSGGLEVWIAHMGGPFWAKKDDHAWSIPKGEFTDDEEPLTAALREFAEEIGTPPPHADYALLGEFRQSSGKIVTAFIAETDFDVQTITSNTFEMEWPPRSGRLQQFPEVDAAAWAPLEVARVKLVKGQAPLLTALEEYLR
ncbi:NUDIX domain-containing protein [Glaciihabitans sp. dw_435]|uniref:NUDIX domain-containing protein n=1 Tax=Glaciihabitans sp. dw_435 TaxID=2720081 RepID=UPI001BD63040|nr:NUDIX domain-containing protein [Glaciihabitans sp. dw_435]